MTVFFSDRFELLGASSVIWIMVNGRQFANAGRVSHASYGAKPHRNG
jgi:hypothetical protein